MKLKGLRWWVLTLIFIATVVNYVDRTAFSLLWPQMGEDLGMDNADYALMLNIFMITYAASKFLSGRLYDKIGTRLGFVVSIIVWSFAAGMHAVAKGIYSLSIVRGLLGLGEAGLWPGAVKNNGEWFPVKQRALAQGIFNAGASIGNVVAPVVIVYLYAQFGWKSTYVILGVTGLIWVLPWLIINKSKPESHPWITDEEKKITF
jgi:ACS family hexuronate transporter-like MFS transporter